tara:strand:+ start:67 stop:693 length:627 start_codon:yes stop_codon:yes gene_type:complete
MPQAKITIPESYADVTVRQYKRMLNLWDETDDAKEAALKAVASLCDLEREVLNYADWSDVSKVIDTLTWLISEPNPLDMTLPLQRKVKLNGVEYGFIPNWTKLTVGEFADLETYSTNGLYDNLEKALAVWYRPITKRKSDDSYSIEPYEPHVTKQEKMLDMPMDVVIGAMVFFYHIEKRLAIDSRLYSLRQAKRKRKIKSTTNGGGMA